MLERAITSTEEDGPVKISSSSEDTLVKSSRKSLEKEISRTCNHFSRRRWTSFKDFYKIPSTEEDEPDKISWKSLEKRGTS